MPSPSFFSALNLLVLGVLPLSGQQFQIDWGSSAINERIITSDGGAVTLAEFSIELGGFGNGFVPTQSNTDQWVNNWQVFDAVTENDTDTNGRGGGSADFFGSDGGTNARFAGTGFLQPNQTSSSEDANPSNTFGPNQQAYVFIRNSDTRDGNAEWLLYTSRNGISWEFPGVGGGQAQMNGSFFVSEIDEVLFGAANSGPGRDQLFSGGGVHTDLSENFTLRTNTFAVVPEPSIALLLICGAGSLLRRRRVS